MATAGDDATAASPGQKEAMERIEMNTISHSKMTTNENDVPKTDASKTDTEIVQMVTEAIDAMIADKPKNKNYKEFGPQIIDFFRQKGDEYPIDTLTAMTNKELGQILFDQLGSKKVKGVATALLKKLKAMKKQIDDAHCHSDEEKENTTSNLSTARHVSTSTVLVKDSKSKPSLITNLHENNTEEPQRALSDDDSDDSSDNDEIEIENEEKYAIKQIGSNQV